MADELLNGPVCRKPPTGWTCSRKSGHDGPCAARPIPKPPKWVIAVLVTAVALILTAAGFGIAYLNRPAPCPNPYYVTVQKQEWTEFGTGARVIAVHDAHPIQEKHCTE